MPLWVKLLLCIGAVEILGGLSGYLTASSIGGWYETLSRPPGTPPNWIFGPVWTLLYAGMGAAFALVWHRAEPSPTKRAARLIFAIQFALNLAWTPLFFGYHRIDLALAVIITLLAAIALTFRRFFPLHRGAAWLLAPYFLWVGYATYLNAGFFVLNR